MAAVPDSPPALGLAAATGSAAARNRSSRLVEIDALRGIAALAVVLFHFTTRFDQLYKHQSPPWFSFPHGFHGVDLFFIISGFVIFMTIEKVKAPMDFVVSRFSRLFPAYWLAILLTFGITHALGLPERTVSLGTAAANFLMVHSLFFGIPHVDGVYWTLQIELLFYFGMLLLFLAGRLEQIHYALFALLALRLIYALCETLLGISLPWVVAKFLILGQIPWFAMGIAIYRLASHHSSPTARLDRAVVGCALAVLLIADSPAVAGLGAVLAAIVHAAASGRLPWLANGFAAWLGAISYTLYLLHENIGWSLMLRLREAGWGVDAMIVAALVASLALASAVTYWVERPAMNRIRAWYRQRRSPAAG